MDNISKLLNLQRTTYSVETAYNYFCEELEYITKMTFKKRSESENISESTAYEKMILT